MASVLIPYSLELLIDSLIDSACSTEDGVDGGKPWRPNGVSSRDGIGRDKGLGPNLFDQNILSGIICIVRSTNMYSAQSNPTNPIRRGNETAKADDISHLS